VLTEPTMEKLRALRLETLGAAWAEQQKKADVALGRPRWTAPRASTH
jgi:hypothetical protein